MKKKEFLSKLKLQKTTIVSFSAINTIKGGTLQGADTQVVSVNGFTCLSLGCIPDPTFDGVCLSQDYTVCSRPTTRTGDTEYCVGNLPTKPECALTIGGC